jgi:hypothetical protein
MKTTLSCWLRLLWDMAPPLRIDGEVPRIIDGAIHLPASERWTDHTAAAAHATAHLIYSPARFDGDGLGPIARSVLALLEDARVEALAIRELPGLARLWRPLHTATPALGPGFEALMERLARSLIDPDYDDPDPWVRKGRDLFYLDRGLGSLALRTPMELRGAATRLGHDIGQMRMPFNAKTYSPAPHYRDDHRWMWAADAQEKVAPPAPAPADGDGADGGPVEAAAESATYPEWDRLIARLRPDWCRVSEHPVADGPTENTDDAIRRVGDRVRTPLRSLTRRVALPGRQDDGDVFDLGALVDWAIARRMRAASDGRVYRARRQGPVHAVVWLLIDQSASTGSWQGPDRGMLLETVVQSATAIGLALQHLGVTFAVAGFSSNGRHDVRFRMVKGFEPSLDWTHRIRSLRPGGSTRLGAALRHATRRLARHDSGSRLLLVLSDGHPHDVDVHDPHYLVDDARRAVHEAARSSVRTVCLVFAGQGTGEGSDKAERVFGNCDVRRIGELGDLPQAIARLVG